MFIILRGGNHPASAGGGSRAPLRKWDYAAGNPPQPTQRVCNPRYRKKVMVGPVEARLKEQLAEIAAQYGFEIMAVEVTPALACGASVPDHVHLFVSAPPKYAPAEIVRLFKGITSRKLKNEFESLRRQYWGENATLWAEGYYAGTAGHVSAETIQRYIEESQKK